MRKILLVLVAIAGVIAIASPIKSMLGADGAETNIEDWTPTAADYIQDGLIAMWDGVENAGWGEHDATIGGCINLVSQGEFDLPYSFADVGDNFIEVSSSNPYINLPEVPGSIQQKIATAWLSDGEGVTIELLVDNSGYGSASRWTCGTRGGGAGSIGMRGCSLCGVGLKNYKQGHDFFPGHWNLQSVVVSRNGYQFFINGELVDEQVTPTFNPNMNFATSMSFASGAAFKFRSWRFYMRGLTPDEIRYNYDLDRLRFNLP